MKYSDETTLNPEETETIKKFQNIIKEILDVYEKLTDAMIICYEEDDDMLLIACALLALETYVKNATPPDLLAMIMETMDEFDTDSDKKLFYSKPFHQLITKKPADPEKKLAYRLKLENAFAITGEYIPGNLELSRQFIQYRSVIDEFISSLLPSAQGYMKISALGGIRKTKNAIQDFYIQHDIDIQLLMAQFDDYDRIVNSPEFIKLRDEMDKRNAS